MTRYLCQDPESGVQEAIPAPTMRAAAKTFVLAGNYPDDGRTFWVDVLVRRADTLDSWTTVTVETDPPEPPCTDDDEHVWGEERTTGSGGGVKIQDECSRCGLIRVIDTWATRPDTGEQGLRSLTYLREDLYRDEE